MTEIRLNKPLYKEDAVPNAPPGPAAIVVKRARPSLIARIGAVLIDVLVLHGVLYGFAKFFSGVAVQLGQAGPYVGWFVGFIYFTVGASPLTQGRTFGKALLRLSVADVSGSDLSWARAIARTFLLMSALIVYIVLHQIGEELFEPGRLSILPSIWIFGVGWAAAWYLGNTFYAAMEPTGRTLYDRLSSSVVIGTDAPAEDVQSHLQKAREPVPPTALRRARIAIAVTFAAMLGFPAMLVYKQHQLYATAPPEELAEEIKNQKLLAVPGFKGPREIPMPRENSTTGTTANATPGKAYQYLRRDVVMPDELRNNKHVLTIVDHLIEANRKGARNAVTSGRFKAEQIPDQMKFQVSFAEYSDLLFASYATNVFTVSDVADFRDLKASIPADAVTTGGATAGDEPSTSTLPSANATTLTATSNSTTSTTSSDGATSR